MSALAIILTAAMAAPGDGAETVSGETERGLDLSGKWEGSLLDKRHADINATMPIIYQDGKLTIGFPGCSYSLKVKFIDQGKGNFRWRDVETDWEALGIYKRQRGQFFICWSEKSGSRPTDFTVQEGNFLLILHRVKSSK